MQLPLFYIIFFVGANPTLSNFYFIYFIFFHGDKKMLNRNQLTTIIDFILAPICVTLGVTDATHNALLNIILVIVPVIATYLSEKYPDNTLVKATKKEEENEEDDEKVVWIEPIHQETEDDFFAGDEYDTA